MGKGAKHDVPPFENLYLQSIADAIAKRRKAIKNHLGEFSLGRIYDKRGNVSFERLDLNLRWLDHANRMSLAIWEDARAWIYVVRLETKAGKTFESELQTNLWDVTSGVIVRRIESTLSLMHTLPRPELKEEIAKIWLA